MFRLDKFYRPYTTTTLPETDESPAVDVVVRALSDLEKTARGRYMLDEAARTINRLKDPESTEYKSWIVPLADATHEQLINILISSYMEEWQQEANEEHPVDFVPYPDNALDEEKLEIEERQKKHEQEVITARVKYLTERVKSFKEKAMSWEDSNLRQQAKMKAVYVYGAEAASLAQTHYTIWCAVEKDGKPYWKSPHDAAMLPEKLLQWLVGLYQEVDAHDPWALTKSESKGNVQRVGEEHDNEPPPTIS